MPDLSHQAVHQFWHQYPDPTIYRVITFMEGVEDWTVDGSFELEDAIKRLGQVLDKIGKIELKKEDDFINLVAHIKTGRGLRLLMCLDNAYPGAAAKVISKAEMNKAIRIALTSGICLFLSTLMPPLAMASISPSDLANASFTNDCSYTGSGDLDDLSHILQYNLCSKDLSDKDEIAQCARIALSQYTVCRYMSILDNSTTSVTAFDSSSNNTDNTSGSDTSGYDSNTTSSDDTSSTTHKIFNWL
jgi:intracellular multiplication protein IcmW